MSSASTPNYQLQFEFPNAFGERELLLFTEPSRVIIAHHIDEVASSFEEVEKAIEEGNYVAGYIAYEAAPAFDPSMVVTQERDFPLVWLGVFDAPSKQGLPDELSTEGAHELAWQPTLSKSAYLSNIKEIRSAIAQGETYQVNYTFRLKTPFAGEPFSFYRQMKRSQHQDEHPYSAFLNLGRYQILSASPELFFRLEQGVMTTKPMKGTSRRGRWLEEDAQRAAELQSSEKNRAENVMIVDLLRNDLGRVSEVGSVVAQDLFNVETYATLLTMTSTIKSKLKPDTSFSDLFSALFPCGSVTGAPKIHTMGLISQLETSPRRVYCGATGYITPERNAVFNVPIRTVLVDSETKEAEYGVGGGVVWDSEAEDEFDEAMLKASFLTRKRPDFELLETLKLEAGEYVLLERHIKRLLASAAYFALQVSERDVRRALLAHAKRWGTQPRRVRLLVDQRGEARVTSSSLDAPATSINACLAAQPVDSEDVFLYHKTTNRTLYDPHLELARAKEVNDVLLWNERGELTEFTKGNVVVELEGIKWTPPRECGLLQGTFAEELLATEQIRHRQLHQSCLEEASAIWFVNSVRGWVEVSLERASALDSFKAAAPK